MEKIIRNIERKRGDKIVIHSFTTFPIIFTRKTPLLAHLAKVFEEGLPIRPTTCSQLPQLKTQWKKVEGSKFVEAAKNAGYRGFSNNQHRIVQDYFLKNVKGTLAVEVPVYDDEATGLMDFLMTEEKRLIIPDFKPEVSKCLPDAMSQLWRYREMLHRNTMIPRNVIDCYAFDDQECYQLTS